jgi:hypothetical protein
MLKKTKSIPYWQIIQEAVKITWKNVYLWWFGFFIALANLGGISNYYSHSENSKNSLFKKQEWFYFVSQNIYWIIAIVFLLVLIYVVLVSLNILGRGALIDSITKQLKKKPANFKTGIKAGKKYFWKIVALTLILSASIFLLILIIFTPVVFLLSSHNYIVGFFLGLLAFIVLVPLLFLISYLKIYGYLYLVLGQLNVGSAIENAYKLLQKNLVPSIIMLLLFIPLNVLWVLLIFMLILPLGFIFFCLGMMMFWLTGPIGAGITILIAGISFLGIVIFLRSIYEVFAQAIWILFFQIIAKPESPKLVKKPVIKTAIAKPTIPIVK